MPRKKVSPLLYRSSRFPSDLFFSYKPRHHFFTSLTPYATTNHPKEPYATTNHPKEPSSNWFQFAGKNAKVERKKILLKTSVPSVLQTVMKVWLWRASRPSLEDCSAAAAVAAAVTAAAAAAAVAAAAAAAFEFCRRQGPRQKPGRRQKLRDSAAAPNT